MTPFELSPSECLLPWAPSSSQPWTRRHASHLLRRTSFGASDEDLNRAVHDGLDATLERLFSPPEASTEERAVVNAEQAVLARKDTDALAAWWLQRMILTTDPLSEKCALLWHSHFACSDDKVRSARAMATQYHLFRHHGLGDLRHLARQVSRDPAMLCFLDGNENRKGAPNENFARELLELFLLGRGHYHERDIKEAARAFTGYRESRGRFVFAPRLHDDAEKTFLRVTGSHDGDGIISICFSQPAAARHLTRRITDGFLSPELPEPYIDVLAQDLKAHDFHLRPFLRRLLASRLFFSEPCYRTLIKSPVEFAIGALRSLSGRANTKALHAQLTSQGQRLFHPPGVQGWAGGVAWLTSSRLTARNRLAASVARKSDSLGVRYELPLDGPADSEALIRLLLDDNLPSSVRRELRRFTGSTAEMLHALFLLPEYQVG